MPNEVEMSPADVTEHMPDLEGPLSDWCEGITVASTWLHDCDRPANLGFQFFRIGFDLHSHDESQNEDWARDWVVEYQSADPKSNHELKREFQELADRWRSETGHLSSPAQIARHPAYLEIIGKGEKVLPFIFEDLRERGGHWYVALRVMTGASPVPQDAAGNMRRVRDAWLQWAKDHDYIS